MSIPERLASEKLRHEAMSDTEFRAIFDKQGMTYGEWGRALARSSRAVRSYYYGERRILRPVADRIRSISKTQPSPRVFESVAPLPKASHVNHANVLIAAGRRLELFERSVAAFCHWCEPDGACHNAKCSLRTVSPVPLAVRKSA